MGSEDLNDVTRRDALRFLGRAGATGAALLLEQCRIPFAQAQQPDTDKFEYFSSPFTNETLHEDTLRSIRQVLDGPKGIQRYPRYWARVARNFFDVDTKRPDARDLLEARMAFSAKIGAPTPQECTDLMTKYPSELASLASEIPDGKYGLLVDIATQRMHLVKNHGGKRIQFIKYYVVSTARKGVSNEEGSDGTPTGMHWIREARVGLFGEDVSATGVHAADFDSVVVDGEREPRTIAKGLSSRRGPPGLISARFLLGNHDTQPERGANIHGTPHEDFLGSEASGGCARVSNAGILDLMGLDASGVPYLEASAFKVEKAKWEVDVRATPVMIVGGTSNTRREERGYIPPERIAPKQKDVVPAVPRKQRPAPLPGYFDK